MYCYAFTLELLPIIEDTDVIWIAFIEHADKHQFYNIRGVYSPEVYIPTAMSLDDVQGHKQLVYI